jgi:hypothetical protein
MVVAHLDDQLAVITVRKALTWRRAGRMVPVSDDLNTFG